MSLNASTAAVEQALLDVRRAYRLIHDYQRMALDAVNHIGKQLGMTYAGGYPKFSDASPRPGKGELDFWSWDWLNLIFYEFHFTRTLPKGNLLRMSILLISDTACFDSGKEQRSDPSGGDFIAAEKSKTEIGFIISAKNWPHPAFLHNNAGMKAFIESSGELPAEMSKEGVIGKCYPFSRLATENDTAALIEELISYANRCDIPLSRSKS